MYVECLPEESVRARFAGLFSVGFERRVRDNYHGDLFKTAVSAYPAKGVYAAHPGHLQIEEYQRGQFVFFPEKFKKRDVESRKGVQ